MNTIEEIRDAYYTHYALHGKPPSSLTLGGGKRGKYAHEGVGRRACMYGRMSRR